MKKKDLIIFMPSIEGGGVEKNLFIISNYLSSKIKNISIITTGIKYRKNFKKINFITPKSLFWENTSRRIKYFICLLILSLILLKNKNYVVFAFQANLYCTLVCKFFGIKIIVRSNSSPSGWSKNFIKKYLYKKILSYTDKIIVNSIDFKKQFKDFFSVNAYCIYNPLNKKEIIRKSRAKIKLNFFKKTDNSLKIINVARFTDQKDQLTLLKGLNLLKKKINFKALIIGKGINEKKLINYIKEKGLNKKIKLLKFQSNPYKFINSSDLFILSSKFEGLPNVLLEAMVLKKFIISTNCPTGPKEILFNGKGGELVPVGDYKAISKKILFFKKNQNKLNKKIIFSYKSLYRFDYKSNLNKYLNIIESLL